MILFFVCVCCILFNFIRALTHHNLVINFQLLLQNYIKLLNLKKNSSALKKILQKIFIYAWRFDMSSEKHVVVEIHPKY